MAFNTVDVPNLLFSAAGTVSSVVTGLDDAYGVGIIAPATLTASQVTVQVAASSGGTFGTLQSGGSDVVLAAGKSLIITPLPYRWLQLASSAGEAASRTFVVTKVFIV